MIIKIHNGDNVPFHGQTITVDGPEFDCSFCKGKCVAGPVNGNPKVQAVTHTVPFCDEYHRMEPDEFLAACVKAKRKVNAS